MSTANAALAIQVMPDLTQAQRNIGVYLVLRSNGRRFCWVSVEEIQADLEIRTRHTVCDATSRLRELGLFRVVRQRRGRNSYYPADALYDQPARLPSSRLRDEDVQQAALQEEVQETAHQEKDVQQTALPDVQQTALRLKTQVRDSRKEEEEVASLPARDARGEVTPLGFDEFYAIFPKKVKRRAAAKAFAAALKRGAKAEDIIAGLRNHKFSPERKYLPHPTTWLNGERWLDEPEIDSVLEICGLTGSHDLFEPLPAIGWEQSP